MRPAARVGDKHVCPAHGPGLIGLPAALTVLIAGRPAARLGDVAVCVGPPNAIAGGSTGVYIEGRPAARLGDPTLHKGKIAEGCPTVLIGEVGAGGAGSVQGQTMRAAKQAALPFTETDCDGEPPPPPPAEEGEGDEETEKPPAKKPKTHFSQEQNNSCVIASSRNLIHQLTGKDVPEDQLRDQIRGIMKKPDHDFNKTPINPAFAVELLRRHGVETTSRKNVPSADLGALVKDDKPAMIGFKNPGHRVVLEKVETAGDGARTYVVQDPARRFKGEARRMSQGEFDKKYNRNAVVIVPE